MAEPTVRNEQQAPRVLSIAGIDPSGGAGLFADIKSIAALGGYGMGAVAAITAQNTRGVDAVYPQPPEVLRAQLDSVATDIAIDAVKIGMLGEPEIVDAVGDWLDATRPPVVVLDPVMVATTGGVLSSDAATARLADLARRASLITPNVPELARLVDAPTPNRIADIADLARHAHEMLGVAVLATTGDLSDNSGADILVERRDNEICVETLPFTRVDTPNTHGTGCSLSAAIATARVTVSSWRDAYDCVRPWLDGALQGGLALRVGGGSGPLDHTWFLRRGVDETTWWPGQ